MTTIPQYVTINGTNYATDKLPKNALEQVANIQVVDEEMRRLQNLLGIAQTAKNFYAVHLLEAMKAAKAPAPVESAEAPTPAKKPRAKKAV